MTKLRFPRFSPTQRRGLHFEQLALRYLQRQGLTLVAQNYRCRGGELDLVMRQRDMLVFVEVRYRQRLDYGSALATVVHSKQRRLILAAQHYLLQHPEYASLPCRFDVIAIGERDE